MSTNYQYTSSDNKSELPAQIRWSQYMMMDTSARISSPHHHHRRKISSSPNSNFNLNHMMTEGQDEDDSAVMEEQNELSPLQEREIPKEPLFQKPLTPSDVGKLNRLVIPKQHAEKYFPLNGSNNDSAGGDQQKGLLLSFEDEVGKCWRFRYSHWNSSQSYVLTKGWSRFVKEKKLDAGDVVLFLRHRVDGGRMFIGWRRKGGGAQPSGGDVAGGWISTDVYCPQGGGGSVSYANNDYSTHAGSVTPNQTTTVTSGYNNSKRLLRLFGVNLECQADSDQSEPSTPVGSPMSTSLQGQVHQLCQPYHHHPYYYNYPNNVNYAVRTTPDI